MSETMLKNIGVLWAIIEYSINVVCFFKHRRLRKQKSIKFASYLNWKKRKRKLEMMWKNLRMPRYGETKNKLMIIYLKLLIYNQFVMVFLLLLEIKRAKKNV